MKKKICQYLSKVLVEMSEEELMQKANAWELKHGGMSGRTATQFITNLLGKEPEE